MSVRLFLLGDPYAETNGMGVKLGSSKTIAVIAYLAAHKQSQNRDRVISLLWPDSTEESGRKNLRNALWSIRRVLDEDIIVTEHDQIALSQTVWVDIDQLQKLDEDQHCVSEELFTGIKYGVFLDNIKLAHSPEYEVWMMGERERLLQQYLRILKKQIERLRLQHNWKQVIALAQKALKSDILQEPMHRHLMEGYAWEGQRPSALRQFELLTRVLLDELGVEPLPETTALKEAILSGTIHQMSDTDSLKNADPKSERGFPVRRGQLRTPYIGRAQEFRDIDHAYERTLSGEKVVVLVAGEMGIGKTRLWQEWSSLLPRDQVVLEARALESTKALPFAPLAELINNRIHMGKLVGTPSFMPPVWLAEIARVVPSLRLLIPDLPINAVLPMEEERGRLYEAFTQYISSLTGQPKIIFIDDVHWIDQSTLDWLDYYLHRENSQGILIVLTYRSEDASLVVARQMAKWHRDGILLRLTLSRLTETESIMLAESIGADPVVAKLVHTQSAGNPYFLIELCRSGNNDISPALTELIRTRLNRFPDTARQILQAASILEPEFGFMMLRRVSGRGEEEILDAIDAILEASVLVEKEGMYSFSHPLVASVLRNGLSAARMSYLHRRAAEAIEAMRTPTDNDVDSRLFLHYSKAGEVRKAAHYADLAARRALELAAPFEAIDLYKQALLLETSPQRQINLGLALQQNNEMDAAQVIFTEAYKTHLAQKDLHEAGKVCLHLAELNLANGRSDLVTYWVEKGRPLLNNQSDYGAHSLAHFLMAAGMSQGGGDLLVAEKHLAKAARIAQQNDHPAMAAHAQFEMGNLLAQTGNLDSAMKAYREALSYAEVAGDMMQVILAHNNLAYHALLAGMTQCAREHITIAINQAEVSAIQMPRQYLYSTRGEIAMADQEWDEADVWFRKGILVAQKAGNKTQEANYLANMALVAEGRADYDTALIQFENATTKLSNIAAPYLSIQIDLWICELHLKRGELYASAQILDRIEKRHDIHQYLRLNHAMDRLRKLLNEAGVAV